MSGYVLREVREQEWDALVDRCPMATVFHRAAWLGSIDATEDVSIARVACERDGVLMGVWPIGLLRKGPLRVGGSPLPGWNTAYLGPVFTDACEDRLGALRAMLRGKPISNPSFVATRCMHTDMDLSGLGFRRTRDFETYEMGLTRDEDYLFSVMKGACRTSIRKGTKNGLEVRVEEDDTYIDDFCAMSDEVFAKSSLKTPYSRRFVEEVQERLTSAGELIVASAFHGEDRVATVMIPHNGRTAMYFAGASYGAKLSLMPNNLLLWEVMRACKDRGLSSFDMISTSGKPGKFKMAFGPAARVSCVHWERTSNPIVKWMREKYEQRARAKRRV